ASQIALDADGRDAAANVANLDAVKQVGNAARWNKLDNRILRESASSFLPRTADQHALHGIANRFARRAGNPRNGWFVETLSLPPFGVSSGRVNCGFHRAGECLAQLIARHQQTLAMLGAGGMKLDLLQIRLVAGELVLVSLCLKIGNKLLNFFGFNRQVHRSSPQSKSAALAAS